MNNSWNSISFIFFCYFFFFLSIFNQFGKPILTVRVHRNLICLWHEKMNSYPPNWFHWNIKNFQKKPKLNHSIYVIVLICQSKKLHSCFWGVRCNVFDKMLKSYQNYALLNIRKWNLEKIATAINFKTCVSNTIIYLTQKCVIRANTRELVYTHFSIIYHFHRIHETLVFLVSFFLFVY